MSGKDFMTNYLKRINDLENPLPSDSKIFLPERSVKDGPKYQSTEVKMSGSRTKEENERLREEYFKSVTEPATLTLDTFPSDRVTEVLDGKGWIVPQLLSPEECEEVIQLGEDWGIGEEDFKVAQELRIRTSNRTNSYCNEELTTRINPRLPEQLLEAVERSTPYTSVRGIHPNWRVARYCAVLYSTLHCTVLYYTVLYCTVKVPGWADLPCPPGPGGQRDSEAPGESEAEVHQLSHSPHQPPPARTGLPGRSYQVLP